VRLFDHATVFRSSHNYETQLFHVPLCFSNIAIQLHNYLRVGRDRIVGIATHYGLDESRWAG
jgi:hypothetical protein